jgi:hypothetical protein
MERKATGTFRGKIMNQEKTIQQICLLTHQLSLGDKVSLVEYLLKDIKQTIGQSLNIQVAAADDANNGAAADGKMVYPGNRAAAIDLLRSWREENDEQEQHATMSVLRQALPEDFPELAVETALDSSCHS